MMNVAFVGRWIAILLLLPLTVTAQETIHYVAKFEGSEWSLEGSNLRCELRHSIPAYGEAVFFRNAGEAIGGYVKPKVKQLFMGEVVIQTLPAPWGSNSPEAELQRWRQDSGLASFEFSSNLAQQLVQELEKGRYPSILYQDELSGLDVMRVSLSSVNFSETLKEFRECVAQLLPFGFIDVRESQVYFRENQVSIERDSKITLDRIALYVKQDPSVVAVMVEGFANSIGNPTHNRELSRLRAENTMLYLNDRGLPRELFELRYYGETRPADSNRTARGRAENRMARVTLLRRQEGLIQ